jgi:glycine/D-amino acid oxidase-like deaminating enzyme
MQAAATDYKVSANWEQAPRPPFQLPADADVVIIGGGIIGVSTAWFLAREGIRVALCEKGHIAGEQSGRNWGWVRQQGRDPRELPMMMASRRIWTDLEEQIGEEVGFQQCGCLFMARTEQQLEELAGWLPVAREHGLDTKVITGRELDDQVSFASQQWKGALYTASDCRAEPHKAAPAIARAAGREGASVLTHCAVRGIETEAGAVSGVVTEHGRIRAKTVLCAAGAWTAMFCRSLDIAVPQLRVRGTVARTAAAPQLLNGCVFDDKVGIRRRQDGGYTLAHGSVLDHCITPSTIRNAIKFLPALRQEFKVLRLSIGRECWEELCTPKRWALDKPSPFESTRVLNPAPNEQVLKDLQVNLAETFPALAGVRLIESWAGMVETTPDVLPVMCESAEIPGFHIATGFSGHGFGIGPGAGQTIAAMLTGTATEIETHNYRLSRFYDGSPIEPMRSV